MYNEYFKHKGFTILEVMVAMVFLAVGLLGIAGLHFATISGNHSASHITMAVNLAEDKIEEFAKSEHFDVYKRLFEELGLEQ